MTLREKAEEYQTRIENCNPSAEAYDFESAYFKGATDVIERVDKWFRNEGPFVFPEDEDTLQDLIKKLQKDL